MVLVLPFILTVVLGFLWQRLAVAPRWTSRWPRWVVAGVLALLLAAVLEGFDVWGGGWTPDQMRPVAWTGAAFIATSLYLILGLAPVWLLCVLIWLFGWRHDHGRALRRRINRVASPLVAVLAVAVTGYGAHEASRPALTAYTVVSGQVPAAFDGARVALVTDLHAGAVRSAAFTRSVVDRVNLAQPDLIIIGGDLVDGTAARYAAEIAPLADLRAPLGVFFVTGNHEMYRDTVNWVAAFERLGLRMLGNRSVSVERGGARITLAGVHDFSGDGVWAPDPGAALAGVDGSGFVLYAAHQPRQAMAVQGRGIDLQLSGHTHGGQLWPVRHLVPLQQPMVEGYAVLGDVPTITSRGAGAWGPAIRVLAPPEIPIITLRRA